MRNSQAGLISALGKYLSGPEHSNSDSSRWQGAWVWKSPGFFPAKRESGGCGVEGRAVSTPLSAIEGDGDFLLYLPTVVVVTACLWPGFSKIHSLEICVLKIICTCLYLLLVSKGQHCFIFIMQIQKDAGRCPLPQGSVCSCCIPLWYRDQFRRGDLP